MQLSSRLGRLEWQPTGLTFSVMKTGEHDSPRGQNRQQTIKLLFTCTDHEKESRVHDLEAESNRLLVRLTDMSQVLDSRTIDGEEVMFSRRRAKKHHSKDTWQ